MATPIEPTEVQDTGPEVTPESVPGPNPAWESVLSVLPEQFHSVVTPEFQKWDQSAQARIQAANEQVAQFEAFKPFVENQVPIEELEQGLRLMYEINSNPQAVYDAIAAAYQLGGNSIESVEGEEEEEDEEETPQLLDPRVDQLQQGLDLVAQTILAQENKKIQEEADREVDAELTGLREKHGDFDENYVLALAANGNVSIPDAHKAYMQLVDNIRGTQSRPFAPSVMGNANGGGGLPSQAIDPTKLDGKATRSLVVEMLAAANKEN